MGVQLDSRLGADVDWWRSSATRRMMSMLGVSVMTKRSFMATEKALGQSWWELLEESMKEAAEEEKRNAIERGSFHEGVPATKNNENMTTARTGTAHPP